MHPHPSHLAPPQPPHLASPPFPAPPALKPARPDSPPPASRQPQGAIHTGAASAESLEFHEATETETKKPRHQEAHDEHALTRHTLASQWRLARPANWDSMTRRARKNWKIQLRPRSYDAYTAPRRPPPRPRRHKHVQTPSPALQAILFFWYFPPPKQRGRGGVGARAAAAAKISSYRSSSSSAPGAKRDKYRKDTE
jgi:hypothetical protein